MDVRASDFRDGTDAFICRVAELTGADRAALDRNTLKSFPDKSLSLGGHSSRAGHCDCCVSYRSEGGPVSPHLPLLRLSRLSECQGRRAHGKRLMRAAVVVDADPVTDGACCVLDVVEASGVDALLFQRPDHVLDHAVLLWVEPAKAPPVRARWRVLRDELLL